MELGNAASAPGWKPDQADYEAILDELRGRAVDRGVWEEVAEEEPTGEEEEEGATGWATDEATDSESDAEDFVSTFTEFLEFVVDFEKFVGTYCLG